MRLTSMQKMLAVIALLLVAAIAVVALLIVPKFTELADLDRQAAEAQAQLDQTVAQLAQLQQAKANAAVTQSELLRLGNEFPENPELPSLIIELQDAANAAGLTFMRISPAEPVAPAGAQYTELPVTVNVQGYWSDVLDYMRRLNRMTRAIRITDVALAPTTSAPDAVVDEETGPKLNLDLTMRAYVMGANGNPPAVPGAAAAPPAATQ